MKRIDVHELVSGVWIKLKYKLGSGVVINVLHEPDHSSINGWTYVEGTFPMIRYKDPELEKDQWCTYLVIDSWERL